MNSFTPKTYQSQVLDSVEAYFQSCHELSSAAVAFAATTERLWGQGLAYHPLAGFPTDMPYFCLRVPTGGGKTWLAAQSVQRVNTHLLRCEHSVILWLTPSKPIRAQTLKALKDRQHPYHAAIGRCDALHKLADEECRAGAYLRPIVLIQAEPRRAGIETLDAAWVRAELINNHRIPAEATDGRFYPDFLCQLPGAILAVEYKGADRWKAAEDDRLIGGLWAELSGGRCRFVMVKDKRWDWIEERLP